MVQLWLGRQRRKKGTSKKVGIKGWIDRKRKKKKGEEMGVLNRPVLTVGGYLCHFDREKNPVT